MSPRSDLSDDILHLILHPSHFLEAASLDGKSGGHQLKEVGTNVCLVCRDWVRFGRAMLYWTTTIALGARFPEPKLHWPQRSYINLFITGVLETIEFPRDNAQNTVRPVFIPHEYFEESNGTVSLKGQIFTTLCAFPHLLSYIRVLNINGLGLFEMSPNGRYGEYAGDVELTSVETREHWRFRNLLWILTKSESLVELHVSNYFKATRFLLDILRMIPKFQLQKVTIDFRTEAEVGVSSSDTRYQRMSPVEPSLLFDLLTAHGPQLRSLNLVNILNFQSSRLSWTRPSCTPLMPLHHLKIGGVYGIGLKANLYHMTGEGRDHSDTLSIFEFVTPSTLRKLEIPLILSFVYHLCSTKDELNSLTSLKFAIPLNIRISPTPQEAFVVDHKIFPLLSEVLPNLQLNDLSLGLRLEEITNSDLHTLIYSLPVSLRSLRFSGDCVPEEHSLLLTEFLGSGQCPNLDATLLHSDRSTTYGGSARDEKE